MLLCSAASYGVCVAVFGITPLQLEADTQRLTVMLDRKTHCVPQTRNTRASRVTDTRVNDKASQVDGEKLVGQYVSYFRNERTVMALVLPPNLLSRRPDTA